MNKPANDTIQLNEEEILRSFIAFADALHNSFQVVLDGIDAMPRTKINPALRKIIDEARPLCATGAEEWKLRKAQAEFLLSVRQRETSCIAAE